MLISAEMKDVIIKVGSAKSHNPTETENGLDSITGGASPIHH
jgi:hypothetical protein